MSDSTSVVGAEGAGTVSPGGEPGMTPDAARAALEAIQHTAARRAAVAPTGPVRRQEPSPAEMTLACLELHLNHGRGCGQTHATIEGAVAWAKSAPGTGCIWIVAGTPVVARAVVEPLVERLCPPKLRGRLRVIDLASLFNEWTGASGPVAFDGTAVRELCRLARAASDARILDAREDCAAEAERVRDGFVAEARELEAAGAPSNDPQQLILSAKAVAADGIARGLRGKGGAA